MAGVPGACQFGKAYRLKPVLYDVLRLFIGPCFVAPRGIDRVDLAYARHFFSEASGDVLGVMPTPWGVRTFERAVVLRGLDRLDELWRESGTTAGEDPGLAQVKAQLSGSRRAVPPPRPAQGPAWWRQARMLAATRLPLGRPASKAPRDALYLNVGQLGWAAPQTMGWLARRPDVAVALMLHDVIALTHPGLFTGFGVWSQQRMLRCAARRLDGLLTTTQAAADAIAEVLKGLGGRVGRTISLPLPLAPGFCRPDAPDAGLAGARYFVVCGALEPRKNHALLLRLWARRPEATLVVIGTPSRAAPDLPTRIQALPGVIHASGLSTPALRLLMRHAQALLMPSLAEGYGLPVQEALSLGVPVIASDIPAHREIAQGQALLLPPEDELAWLQALRAPPDPPIAYQAMTGPEYFQRIEAFLSGL